MYIHIHQPISLSTGNDTPTRPCLPINVHIKCVEIHAHILMLISQHVCPRVDCDRDIRTMSASAESEFEDVTDFLIRDVVKGMDIGQVIHSKTFDLFEAMVRVYACIYSFTNRYVRVSVCVHVYGYGHAYIYVCVCVYIYGHGYR